MILCLQNYLKKRGRNVDCPVEFVKSEFDSKLLTKVDQCFAEDI